MKTFKLPDLGEGLQEAEIVAWHVNAGDHIVVDQPLLSVETDKAIVDVPSPFAGKVLTLHAKVGDVLLVGIAQELDQLPELYSLWMGLDGIGLLGKALRRPLEYLHISLRLHQG